MKRILILCLMIAVALPAAAVEGTQVEYIGGTVIGVNAGTIGRLDTVSETALVFEYSGGKLVIPYNAIQSFKSWQEVSRHLGVLPAIAIGLVKKRRHRHLFRISYRDAESTVQVAIFEVPKQMPLTLEAVLQVRRSVEH